jgi:DNA-binding ferritin-like protein
MELGVSGSASRARQQIVWSKDEYYRESVFKESDASWERTSRGYQELLRRYPHSLELQSQYAFLAAEAEDRDTARQMFERIGPRVDPEVWTTRDYFVSVRNWAMP